MKFSAKYDQKILPITQPAIHLCVLVERSKRETVRNPNCVSERLAILKVEIKKNFEKFVRKLHHSKYHSL